MNSNELNKRMDNEGEGNKTKLTDHIRSAVDRPCHNWNLQQRSQLFLVLDGRLWVHEATVIRDNRVGADKRVSGDRLSEDFYAKDVTHDFLRLPMLVGFPNIFLAFR